MQPPIVYTKRYPLHFCSHSRQESFSIRIPQTILSSSSSILQQSPSSSTAHCDLLKWSNAHLLSGFILVTTMSMFSKWSFSYSSSLWSLPLPGIGYQNQSHHRHQCQCQSQLQPPLLSHHLSLGIYIGFRCILLLAAHMFAGLSVQCIHVCQFKCAIFI